jgi:two-component system phosphate regulon sensor histidine kinase PhoR
LKRYKKQVKLNIFFIIIVLYIVLAFTWLTFSLIDFTNREYKLKNQILKAGREACMLKVIEKAKSGGFNSKNAVNYNLRQIELDIDTIALNKYLAAEYFGSFQAKYSKILDKNVISIEVSSVQKEELRTERKNNTRFYIIEALVLTILVGAGIYGVYYGVSFLYDLNKQQNNFLLSVTHEFKTPLAAIKLMLQTIVVRNLDKEKAMGLLNNAIENTDRLNELTENMLTAMQIENNRYNYSYEWFSLSDMMNDIAEHFKINGEIISEIQEGIEMGGDPFILKITVNNLVENAFKYANGSAVTLKLYVLKNLNVIEVCDQGPGIPNKHKKRVFKKFYRIEDEETRNTKGTGLGLYIAKQAISKHDGNIVILDNSPHGTIFRITLPVKK